MKMNPTKLVLALLIPVSFVLLVLACFYDDYYVRLRYVPAAGVIREGYVKSVRQAEDCGEDCTEYVTAFRPEFVYEFNVNGVGYFGSRYRTTLRGQDRDWAEKVVGDNPIGKELTIYYDPSDPTQSVITTDLRSEALRAFNTIPWAVLFMVIAYLGHRGKLPNTDDEEPFPYEGFRKLE